MSRRSNSRTYTRRRDAMTGNFVSEPNETDEQEKFLSERAAFAERIAALRKAGQTKVKPAPGYEKPAPPPQPTPPPTGKG